MLKKGATYVQELKTAREDLVDLEKYVREFVAFLPLAVCTVNSLKFILDANAAFQSLTGYAPLEVTGRPVFALFLEKDEIEKLLNEVPPKGVNIAKEFILVTKEGKEVPVSVAVAARRDEKKNFIGYFISLTDITQSQLIRKELEDEVLKRTQALEIKTEELANSRLALMNMLEDVEASRKALMNMLEDFEDARVKAEEERDKTQLIVNNLADGLLFFDVNGRLSMVNPETEKFFGIDAELMLNKKIEELGRFSSIKPLTDLLGNDLKQFSREEIAFREDMSIDVTSSDILRKKEKIGTIIILHDVTREKIIERMKTEFVSISAHQLRTPLSAIKWTLRMLLDGDLGKLSKEQLDFLEKTYQSNERMIDLINDLLNVTRIEEGRYIFKPVSIQLEDLCKEIIANFHEEIVRKQILLGFLTPNKNLPPVKVDVDKIKLVIENLIDNAIKYTKSGGNVTISLKGDIKEVEFEVKDSGVGIPADQQKRIFSRFFRGANIVRLDTTGTGLGLFIAKNIIDAHRGKIWFESKENKGTTFHFTLPAAD